MQVHATKLTNCPELRSAARDAMRGAWGLALASVALAQLGSAITGTPGMRPAQNLGGAPDPSQISQEAWGNHDNPRFFIRRLSIRRCSLKINEPSSPGLVGLAGTITWAHSGEPLEPSEGPCSSIGGRMIGGNMRNNGFCSVTSLCNSALFLLGLGLAYAPDRATFQMCFYWCALI